MGQFVRAPLCCSFLLTLFPRSSVVAPWAAEHSLPWCLQQRLSLHQWLCCSQGRFSPIFFPHFSFSLPFLPCLNYIFPEAPHLWQWSSAVSSGGVLWSQLNPPVSARSSPNLFPESPVLQLLLSTPGHSHTTRPPTSQDPAITSRHQYTQGMDLSALLCVILPLCLSWSLCQERQVEGIK